MTTDKEATMPPDTETPLSPASVPSVGETWRWPTLGEDVTVVAGPDPGGDYCVQTSGGSLYLLKASLLERIPPTLEEVLTDALRLRGLPLYFATVSAVADAIRAAYPNADLG